MELSVSDDMTLELFQQWNVKALQEFLGRRGWNKTGNKETLAARAFTAWELAIPINETAEEIRTALSSEYRRLLIFNGQQLPDPGEIIHWTDEQHVDIYDWPAITFEGTVRFTPQN